MNGIKIFRAVIASTLVLAFPADASTPDEKNPAQENICDPLQADGVTKGLYGLCVAFCEARDITSEEEPITVEYLEERLDEAPSVSILNAYNKKKRDADPEMPCIVVDDEEPCPCWTNNMLTGVGSYLPNSNVSCAGTGDWSRSVKETNGSETILLNAYQSGTLGYCQYYFSPIDWGTLATYTGTLTLEKAAACLEQVKAHCGY